MRPAATPALRSPGRTPGLLTDLAGDILESIGARIVVVNGDGLIIAVNRAWADFVRAQSHALAQPSGVGASYFDFCRDMLAAGCAEMAMVPEGVRAVNSGASSLYQCECSHRAHGDESLCLVTATPLRGAGGVVIAHTVVDRDATERCAAEWALRDVASKLVAAQETERSRIGRELHDDLGQRAALLAVKLEQLSGNTRMPAAKLRAGVADAERMLHELAVSIHELSYQLHPAKLRLLGLVATLEALCRDSGARVSFSAHNIPAHVPEQTALCVFRVTQEALQNAVKHSGAEDIHVQLRGTGSHLTLRVSDTGSGFDPRADRAGIGLVTMHERVELSGGSLKIEAARSTGTTIEATIPLSCIDSDMPS
jgi:signal transduction histidine kinase